MSEKASEFLAAVERLPHDRYPATHSLNGALSKLYRILRTKLPPHLLPLLVRFRAFCVRQAFAVETRVHINPTFRLLLSTRVIPPGLAFIAAAASTVYVLRYLYINALDLLTNLVGIAYPAYQSIMCIEYGELSPEHVYSAECGATEGRIVDRALGINEPNLDKKQWLMYWSIFGLLTTADHWAGPILRLFPMYRLAKLAVLIWAQHRKYNGAAWLYDTFVRPLLPPPSSLTHNQPHAQTRGSQQQQQDVRTEVDIKAEIASVDTATDGEQSRLSFASLAVPSVWETSQRS
ncbi:hypothetical protein LPJ78_000049 [Coemansia sp. RSA 989]|nr:TB2/DP1, HVA22 family-domain-containing protein [Coemansia mojavensis]KAJ1744411.1 hypothetical protein LPJ68_000091 [Coemansia sp. RSA 1086]KAJ1753643.1 hypothetical protein LPJ79_000236 [Coemansia sp. RSA 1821]KAJ1868537.1 hypothetical protein LPJ78_000049 [Coemansia sp. RSA 989]KAJ1876147.1 hypothetical protein LPJ55_000049 [Coemansia sp. RSA 990]KAJ2628571.1 hypothetical protein H4R22_003806 [Coemansia sp. RSA 1290]